MEPILKKAERKLAGLLMEDREVSGMRTQRAVGRVGEWMTPKPKLTSRMDDFLMQSNKSSSTKISLMILTP